MDSANWLTAAGQAARLVVESIPNSLWLAYNWAKDWQFLLGGLLVLFAAQIFARASVRSARIRAAASVRAAQVAAGISAAPEERPVFRPASGGPPPQARGDLIHKLEQLRSLVRSAMALVASDIESATVGGNVYCERLARLHFDESDLPSATTKDTLELYRKFLSQLATVRRAGEKKLTQRELSEALFQLNARARALTAAISPATTKPGAERARPLPGQVRV